MVFPVPVVPLFLVLVQPSSFILLCDGCVLWFILRSNASVFMNHLLLLSVYQFLEQLTGVPFEYAGGKGTNSRGDPGQQPLLLPVSLG